MEKCSKCGSTNLQKNGRNKYGNQKYKCPDCGAFPEDGLDSSGPKKEKQVIQKPTIGISIAEFRKKHDVDYIVEETLKKLRKDTLYE